MKRGAFALPLPPSCNRRRRRQGNAQSSARVAPLPMPVLLILAAFARATFQQALDACPNSCSLVGTCGAGDTCACPASDLASFYGGDCSLRRCPFAPAFADPPLGDLNHDGEVSGGEVWPLDAQAGEAHFPRECGGAGLCDAATARCACFPGFEGAACARASCPGSPPCSGRGVCLPVEELAALAGAPAYRLWDAGKGHACACDPGYAGLDCAARECPLGPPAGHAGDISAVSFSVSGGQRKVGYRLVALARAPAAPNASSPVFSLSSDVTARYQVVWARNVARVEAAVRAIPNGGGATLVRAAVTGGGGDATNDPQLRVTLFFAGPPPALVLQPAGVRPGTMALAFPPGAAVHWFSLPGGGGAYVPVLLQVWLGAAPAPRRAWAAAHGEAPIAGLDLHSTVTTGASVAAALSGVPHLKRRGVVLRGNVDVVVALGSDLVSYVVMVLVPPGTPQAPPLRFRHGNSAAEVEAKEWMDATPLLDNFAAPPWVPCSDRGACDGGSGLCRCFEGAAGAACEGGAVVRSGATSYPPQPPPVDAPGGGAAAAGTEGPGRRLSAPHRRLAAPRRRLAAAASPIDEEGGAGAGQEELEEGEGAEEEL